jgi:membrane protein
VSLLKETFRFSPRDLRPLFRYWMETEVHVFAFSIAANTLLSFYPFLLVMVALCRHVFHWSAGEQAIQFALQDYFAGTTGDFLARNLTMDAYRTRSFEWVSMLLLLFTANGIFMPLEVALNRAWGVARNRTFWRNQLLSMGLIFGCGFLALISTSLTAVNSNLLEFLFGKHQEVVDYGAKFLFKVVSLPLTITVLFFVYWRLPNTRIQPRLILPSAIRVGVALEVLKWVNLLVWPWLYQKLEREYGVFRNSVTILVWSFFAGMIVLAGAEASARQARALQEAERASAPPFKSI